MELNITGNDGNVRPPIDLNPSMHLRSIVGCTDVRMHGSFPQEVTRDRGNMGLSLDDFCGKPEAKIAKLSRAEVAALRLYTSSSFRLVNNPLRARSAQ
eukprot:395340-Pyramimonas_sp.AAC.1